MTFDEKKVELKNVFSPTSPIKEKDFFAGRIEQINRIVSAVNEYGQHAILYGERGVGKTSLANIMSTSFTNVFPAKVTCSRNDTFKTLWVRALNEIQVSQTTDGIGFNPQNKTEIISLGQSISQNENLLSSDIEQLLRSFPVSKFLFFFDEFDTILNNKTRSSFSDLIKSLSDNLPNITIVIVGIADNVENLIANHQSLERCLMQVKMPRMSDQELEEIVVKGFTTLDMMIPTGIIAKIVSFSSGFPHYTHLLCRNAASFALGRNSNDVTSDDLNAAIKKGVDDASEQLRMSYRKAVLSSSSKSQWKEVLFSCALADTDEFDVFSTNDVLSKFNKLKGKDHVRENITYNLGKFCSEERGNILEKIEVARSIKYKFVNPMMKAYIKLIMNLQDS
jgi:Cdc6-like AAA superfamily ATPase